mmetsp:Transcript_73177/g.184801  ORF Transcript_73177/g.184801 Transcript_73177/m.184801 type:complete len:139 (-) Transcript_73177:126-542(-)
MMRTPMVAWLVGVSLLSGALGHGTYQKLFPNGDKVMRNGEAWPAVGHMSPGYTPDKNPFGLAFSAAGHEWTTQLCQEDSDGDGQTNGLELGDPLCEWTPGSTPARVEDISHPGFGDSVTAAADAGAASAPGTSGIVLP